MIAPTRTMVSKKLPPSEAALLHEGNRELADGPRRQQKHAPRMSRSILPRWLQSGGVGPGV